MDLIAFLVIAVRWPRQYIKEKRRITAIEATIKSIKTEYDRAENWKMPAYKTIHNVSLYILLVEYDFIILESQALSAIATWKRKFVARQMAILIYEVSQDLPILLGKEFRSSLKSLKLSEPESLTFNQITKQLNEFKKTNQHTLQLIRNFAGAHRDHNAAKQLETIQKVELINVMAIGAELYKPIHELIPFMIRLTILMGHIKNLIHHIPPELYTSKSLDNTSEEQFEPSSAK